jgi:lipopolysaccharide transport system permease protein
MISYYLPLMRRRRLIHLRDLLYELVIRDIKVRYKGSSLGIAWSLLNSLAQLRIFGFLFRSALGRHMANYPTYIFSGIIVWSWFQTSLLMACETITTNRELVKRPGFPAIILPPVTIATSLIDFIIAFPILLIFIVTSGGKLTSALLALPLIMTLQFLLTLGLAYLMATFQVTFRDTKHLLNVILRLGFFLTPIFYDLTIVPAQYQWLYALNPLVHLLALYRAVLLYGELPDPMPLLIISVLAAVLLPLGYKTFINARYRFMEEL